jgi:hypothetical protein
MIDEELGFEGARLNRLRERLSYEDFVSGHDFSRADKLFVSCYPDRASAREGSAVLTFSAACSAVPLPNTTNAPILELY